MIQKEMKKPKHSWLQAIMMCFIRKVLGFLKNRHEKKNPVSQCLARGKVLLMLRDRRDTIGPNTFQIRILAN